MIQVVLHTSCSVLSPTCYVTYSRELSGHEMKQSEENKSEQIDSEDRKICCLSFHSINHGRHTPGSTLPRLPYGTTPGGHASQVSMQAPSPY